MVNWGRTHSNVYKTNSGHFGYAEVNISKIEVNIGKTKVKIGKTEVNIGKTEVNFDKTTLKDCLFYLFLLFFNTHTINLQE